MEEDAATALRYFRVETVLDNSQGLLRSNVSGYAKINCGEVPLGLWLTRGAVRWVRLHFLL